MTESEEAQLTALKSMKKKEAKNDALYNTIVHALIVATGYATKPEALKTKADELFNRLKKQ